MSGGGVMPGRHYPVTPVTLNLTTSRVNPRFHSLPIRHQQQFKYESDSAKCFIYKTQMHLQSFSPHSTLPDIRTKSSNINRGNYDRFSSVEEIVDRSEELLPNIRSCSDEVSEIQNVSQKGLRYNVMNLELEDEAQVIKHGLQLDSLKGQTSGLSISRGSGTEELTDCDEDKSCYSSKRHTDLNKDNASSRSLHTDTSIPNCDENNLPGFKTPKKKHKKKKTKSRKSEGRKSRIFNHRLKSTKKNAYIESHDTYPTASQNDRSSVLKGSQPLALLSAQVKPIKVVQREPGRKSAHQGLFHSASRPSDLHVNQSSPRLANRSRTHLAISSTQSSSIRSQMPNVVASPMTPWMDNELSIPESPQKRIHELIISSQRSPAPSPRFSQELRKLTKVYLSEKQSGKLQELGMDLPCAPPATPAPEMYEKYEYVPSMADIRSQRAVKMRLEILGRQERKLEEKLLEAKLRKEKKEEKDKEKANRRRQRKEMYALNKVMTELEHANFKEFCKAKGTDPKI